MADEYLNRNETAKRLGLTTRQINNLVDAGMPVRSRSGKRQYPFPDVLQWYIGYKVTRAVADATPKDLDEARARKMEADAKLSEMEVGEREGELVPVEEAFAEWGKVLDGLRASLLAFPAKHAHEMVGCKTIAAVRAKLEPAVHELMAHLAGADED